MPCIIFIIARRISYIFFYNLKGCYTNYAFCIYNNLWIANPKIIINIKKHSLASLNVYVSLNIFVSVVWIKL